MLGYFYDKLLQQYCLKFLGSDKSVVERTQKSNNDFRQINPVDLNPSELEIKV